MIEYKRNYQIEIKRIKEEILQEVLQEIEVLEHNLIEYSQKYNRYKEEKVEILNNQIEKLNIVYIVP
jgi:GTPase SAR1 family protein